MIDSTQPNKNNGLIRLGKVVELTGLHPNYVHENITPRLRANGVDFWRLGDVLDYVNDTPNEWQEAHDDSR